MAVLITGLTKNTDAFLGAVNVMLLVLRTIVEGTTLMIVPVPLLKPVLAHFGIDPVHFGIVIIVNLSIGTVTLPVGTVLLLRGALSPSVVRSGSPPPNCRSQRGLCAGGRSGGCFWLFRFQGAGRMTEGEEEVRHPDGSAARRARRFAIMFHVEVCGCEE
ncbi:hypothetical protein GCM10007893_14500 [Paracoccus marinus]|nr:hypothetical protein GCM10007893_14500 [Paracoccus marinus]